MPLYFFHLTDGTETLPNPKGVELPGPSAAVEEATVLARELNEDEALPDGRPWDGWFVAIKDQQGQTIETVPIADVPQA